MKRTHLPLNALRVFDAAARHLSFTRAADELAVISRRHAFGRTRMGHNAIDLELLADLGAIGLADADDRAVAARVNDRAAHEEGMSDTLSE